MSSCATWNMLELKKIYYYEAAHVLKLYTVILTIVILYNNTYSALHMYVSYQWSIIYLILIITSV